MTTDVRGATRRRKPAQLRPIHIHTTTEAHKVREPHVPATTFDRILRLGRALEVTGLSRTALYRLVKCGRFPAPIKLTERASGFSENAVQAWVADRIKAAGTTLKA